MEDGLPVRIRAIVGLGNPGQEYDRTRHNLGYEVVNMLKGESEFVSAGRDYLSCETSISSSSVVLLKPTTYMNRSGKAVRNLADYRGYAPQEILVIADDFNLPLGRIRIRKGGSDAIKRLTGKGYGIKPYRQAGMSHLRYFTKGNSIFSQPVRFIVLMPKMVIF